MVDRSLNIWTATGKAMGIAKIARVKWADIIGKRKTRRIAAVRHAIARELRRTTDLSFPEIGRILNRDHSTVIYALRKVNGPGL